MKNQCIDLMSELLQLWSCYERTLDDQFSNEINNKENTLTRYYAYVSYHPQYFQEISPMFISYNTIRKFKINCINMLKEKTTN